LGENRVIELKENGNKIKLHQSNKEEYVFKYCEYLLKKHIEKQFKAFKRGFDRVVDTQLIKVIIRYNIDVQS
jgi:ubiquitin-protein ligase E3 A